MNVCDIFQFMCKHLCDRLGLAPGFCGINPNAGARLTEMTNRKKK